MSWVEIAKKNGIENPEAILATAFSLIRNIFQGIDVPESNQAILIFFHFEDFCVLFNSVHTGVF
jgi:hypothetical protein